MRTTAYMAVRKKNTYKQQVAYCIKIVDLTEAPVLGPQTCVRQACAIRPVANRIGLRIVTRQACAQQVCANRAVCAINLDGKLHPVLHYLC